VEVSAHVVKSSELFHLGGIHTIQLRDALLDFVEMLNESYSPNHDGKYLFIIL
jgi:hypothetical protein